MRKSRFTEAQIIGMIKEQEAGMPTAEVCRRHGLSPATFYKLKSRYGGMQFGIHTAHPWFDQPASQPLDEKCRLGGQFLNKLTSGKKMEFGFHAQVSSVTTYKGATESGFEMSMLWNIAKRCEWRLFKNIDEAGSSTV